MHDAAGATAPHPDGPWHALTPGAVATALGVDAAEGLSGAEAAARLERHGRNELVPVARPSAVRAVAAQLLAPTVLLRLGMVLVAVAIREVSAGILLALLVLLDVVVGANEALKAASPIDGLGRLATSTARVRRGGRLIAVNATELVPGDVVALGPGETVPADGRLVRADGLVVHEAIVTGQPGSVAKSVAAVADAAVPLAGRTATVFAGSTVATGTGELVVTTTGMATELGAIAKASGSGRRPPSPLGRQLQRLSRGTLVVALGALLVVATIGWLRELPRDAALLLALAVLLAAVPAVGPTFIRAALAVAVQRMAAGGAAVRRLDDVASLGAAGAIVLDPSGSLTVGAPAARSLLYRGAWYSVGGDPEAGRVFHVAGAGIPDFDRLAYLSALAGTASTAGDRADGEADQPASAALAGLARWLGVDAAATRAAYPALATLPFDAGTGLAATIRRLPLDGPSTSVPMLLVHGRADAVLACSEVAEWSGGSTAPLDEVRTTIESAERRLRDEGLEVVALAARRLADGPGPDDRTDDPAGLVHDLAFVGLVGLGDVVRPGARGTVDRATAAGIEVRIVTAATPDAARALADELGLPARDAGRIVGGPTVAALTDAELAERASTVSVVATASGLDRLRLVRAIQARGTAVTVAGHGVVDAPALRAADAGVAMASRAEVVRQAASIVVADGDPATVVRAIGLARETWRRVEAIVRLQATQLVGLVVLIVVAALLGINDGLALTPVQVLALGSAVAVFPVVAIASDLPEAPLVDTLPSAPPARLGDGRSLVRWLVYGTTLGLSALVAYPLCELAGWGQPAFQGPSVPTTMAFLVVGVGTLLAGLAHRRALDWAFKSPLPRFLGTLALPLVLLFLATELRVLQQFLSTVDLRQEQWGVALLLGTAVFLVIETDKLLQRRVRIRFH